MSADRRLPWLLIACFVLLAIASLAPIRSYDYFWHLATGRWIVEHRALPLSDPFGVASSREPWINLEWLFEIVLYGIYLCGGHTAVALVLAIATGALFALLLHAAGRELSAPVALPLILVSWYGAEAWLRERPSAAGAFCLALLLLTLSRLEGARRIAAVTALTVIWINLHPSALLAPVVIALWEIGEALESGDRRLNRSWTILASAAPLLANPWGAAGLLAPFRLTALVGAFHNQEWAASALREFPLFYAAVAAAAIAFIWHRPRQVARPLVFALLALLAVRYCRNQGLFFVALPLLVAPALPRRVSLTLQRVLLATTLAVFLAILANAHFATGIDRSRFPVDSVARLRASGLSGPVYSSYALGGYLIWTFYPERRAVTDGRNELYVAYNANHARAMVDGQTWRALLGGLHCRLAVFDHHRPPVNVVDPRSGRTVSVRPERIYFPPSEWSLIAIDRVAMVFAKRESGGMRDGVQ